MFNKFLLGLELVISIFVFCSCNTESEITNTGNRYNTPPLETGVFSVPVNMTDADIQDVTMYYITDTSVCGINLTDGKNNIITTAFSQIKAIYTSKDGIFIYDKNENAIIGIDFNGVEFIRYSNTFPAFNCTDIVVYKKWAALTDGKSLFIYDIKSGKTNEIEFETNIKYSAINQLFILNSEKLIINFTIKASSVGGEYKAYIFNIQNNKIEELSLNNNVIDYFNGNIYYADNISLKQSINNESINIVYNFNKTEYNKDGLYYYNPKKMFMTGNNIIIWNNIHNVLLIDKISEKTDKVVMILPSSLSDQYADIINNFTNENDTSVEIITYSDNDYINKVNTKLLAGDNDFDLFYINYDPDNMILSSILRNGAYRPLNNYTGLIANLNGMYAGMVNLITYNNNIFAVPLEVIYDYIVIAENANNYIKEVPEIGWTYDNMWQICDELYSNGNEKSLFSEKLSFYYIKGLIYNWVITVFDIVHGEVKENAQEDLSNLLNKIDSYKNKGVLFGSDPLIKLSIGGSMPRFNDAANYTDTGIPLILPQYNEKSGVNLTLNRCIMMNKNSLNSDAAAEFLTTLTNNKWRYCFNIFMSPLYPDYKNYYDKNGVIAYENCSADVDELFISLEKLYSHSTINLLGSPSEITNIVRQYSQNEITAQTAADEIYKQLSYRILE